MLMQSRGFPKTQTDRKRVFSGQAALLKMLNSAFRSFLWVSVLMYVTNYIGNFADSVIAGQILGENALSAIAVASPLLLITSMLGNFCMGGATIAAHAIGEADRETANVRFTQSLVISILMTVITIIVGMVFATQIVDFICGTGVDESLRLMAWQYIVSTMPGIALIIPLMVLNAFLRLDGSKNLTLIAIAVIAVLDIVLDLLIVAPYGIIGLGVATTISYIAGIGVLLTHFRKKSNTLKLVAKGARRDPLFAIFKVGAPYASGKLCEYINMTIMTVLAFSYAGPLAGAALNVRSQSINVLLAVVYGFIQAGVPIIGVMQGDGDRVSQKRVFYLTLNVSVAFCLAAMVLTIFFPQLAPLLMGIEADSPAMPIACNAMVMLTISLVFRSANTTVILYCQNSKRENLATILSILELLLLIVPFEFLLGGLMGTDGLWASFIVSEALTFFIIFTMGTIRSGKRSLRTLTLDGLMMYTGEEAASEDAYICLEINADGDRANERDLSEFMNRQGYSQPLQEQIFACLRLARATYGQLAPNEKKLMVLSVSDCEECVHVRMRDNGATLNPYEQVAGDEIRALLKTAQRCTYNNNINLNCSTFSLTK